jgi:hypothetical protein
MFAANEQSNFAGYLMRHGEHGIQAIIEGYEKREGIVCANGAPLQERWEALVTGQMPVAGRKAS